MLDPYTALYRPFLKHCTLTNKAAGIIWRALSKPPYSRQGPDRPLIVIQDSYSHQTWTPFQKGGAQPALLGCHSIYFLYIIFITYDVCLSIFMITPLGAADGLLSI